MPLYLFFLYLLNHLGSEDTICESTRQRWKQDTCDFKMMDEEKGHVFKKNIQGIDYSQYKLTLQYDQEHNFMKL